VIPHYILKDTLNEITLSRHLHLADAIRAQEKHLAALKAKHGEAARLPYSIEHSEGKDISQEIQQLTR
jgi:hypothetical protein